MSQIADFTSGRLVQIKLDGQVVEAREGEPLAAVFLRQDDMHTRRSFPSAQPRGPFCMMGVCFECVVHVEGLGATRSCQELVREGLSVWRQDSVRGLK